MRIYILALNIMYKENPLHFEWDKFIPTMEKDFLDVLNEMPNDNSQHQPLNT